MKKLILILCCFPLLMAATCEDNDDNAFLDTNCSEEAVAGLNVKVKDATTGEYLSDGVFVTAEDGTYIEQLDLVPDSAPPTFAGAWERVGLYTLTVQKDGYLTQITNAYPVTRNVCHVIPKTVTVELTPQ